MISYFLLDFEDWPTRRKILSKRCLKILDTILNSENSENSAQIYITQTYIIFDIGECAVLESR